MATRSSDRHCTSFSEQSRADDGGELRIFGDYEALGKQRFKLFEFFNALRYSRQITGKDDIGNSARFCGEARHNGDRLKNEVQKPRGKVASRGEIVHLSEIRRGHIAGQTEIFFRYVFDLQIDLLNVAVFCKLYDGSRTSDTEKL